MMCFFVRQFSRTIENDADAYCAGKEASGTLAIICTVAGVDATVTIACPLSIWTILGPMVVLLAEPGTSTPFRKILAPVKKVEALEVPATAE